MLAQSQRASDRQGVATLFFWRQAAVIIDLLCIRMFVRLDGPTAIGAAQGLVC
jgi:hypothetical protein